MRRRLATALGLIVAAGLLAIGLTSDQETSTTAPPSTTSTSIAAGVTTTTLDPTTTTTVGQTTTTTQRPSTTTTTTTTTATQRPATTTTRPVTTSRPPAPPTTTTTATPAPGLRIGASGPEVTALQQRLADLGYWHPAVDGRFGDGTAHAVVALQKAAGLPRTGVVDPATASALLAGLRPSARTASGRTVEIDLAKQVLLLVQDGHVEHIFDTSTGRPGLATPEGEFRIHNQIDTADYHGQYRPKQFYAPRDLAIHGYSSVPPTPYSHGCARVTLRAMDWLWAAGRIPVGTSVLIY